MKNVKGLIRTITYDNPLVVVSDVLIKWSEGRDLNPRRLAWQASILPLNYPRMYFLVYFQQGADGES